MELIKEGKPAMELIKEEMPVVPDLTIRLKKFLWAISFYQSILQSKLPAKNVSLGKFCV